MADVKSVLEKYRKLEKLGEGTYGEVYKVEDKATREILAMKRIRLEHQGSASFVQALTLLLLQTKACLLQPFARSVCCENLRIQTSSGAGIVDGLDSS